MRPFSVICNIGCAVASTGIDPNATNSTAPCEAYRKLGETCNQAFPHTAILNSTHNIACDITPKGVCKKVHQEVEVTLNRNSWWHCQGDINTCMGRFSNDVETNLMGIECWNGPCGNFTAPDHLVNLEELAKQIVPSNMTSLSESGCQFTSQMELVANLVVQKARYCRFDMEAYSMLIGMISGRSECFSGGSAITNEQNNVVSENNAAVAQQQSVQWFVQMSQTQTLQFQTQTLQSQAQTMRAQIPS